MSRTVAAAVLVVLAIPAAAAQPSLAPPSAVATTAPVAEAPPATAAAAPSGRWLAIGVLSLDRAQVDGVRLQLDLLGGRARGAGVAGAVLAGGDQVNGTEVPAVSGVGYVAATVGLLGPLSLRGQLGLGGELGARATDAMATTADALSTTLVGEAGVTLGLDLGARWGLAAGAYLQTARDPAVGADATTTTWFAGLRRRR